MCKENEPDLRIRESSTLCQPSLVNANRRGGSLCVSVVQRQNVFEAAGRVETGITLERQHAEQLPYVSHLVTVCRSLLTITDTTVSGEGKLQPDHSCVKAPPPSSTFSLHLSTFSPAFLLLLFSPDCVCLYVVALLLFYHSFPACSPVLLWRKRSVSAVVV